MLLILALLVFPGANGAAPPSVASVPGTLVLLNTTPVLKLLDMTPTLQLKSGS